MSGDDAPGEEQRALDVVLVGGDTEDGQGKRVLRARSGRLETGEVRPLRDGKPLGAGEIVRLERRKDTEAPVFDVHVEHVLERPAQLGSGPAQVATEAYRASWERTFGPRPN